MRAHANKNYLAAMRLSFLGQYQHMIWHYWRCVAAGCALILDTCVCCAFVRLFLTDSDRLSLCMRTPTICPYALLFSHPNVSQNDWKMAKRLQSDINDEPSQAKAFEKFMPKIKGGNHDQH
jgi:hypothetical protein